MTGSAGSLTLCATPIGNLGDITLRALDTLRNADVILAEDTRRTAVLLRHHGIRGELTSYHEHNEAARIPWVLERLRQGARVVLVSDAGTPGLADPGFRLVRAAIAAGISMSVLPGASALLPALTLSGLPTHRFAFHGFVPRTVGERRSAFQEALESPLTAVWYESPRRLPATLRGMRDAGYGARPAAVARELTKLHEEVVRGTVEELAERFAASPPRGEVVLCVGPPVAVAANTDGALEEVLRLVRAGTPLSTAAATVAHQMGASRRDLYARALDRRDGPKGPKA